jgi:hypothetical protein
VDDLALLGRLEPRLRAVARVGRERLERLPDDARLVTLRDVLADEAPLLAAQAVGDGVGRLLGVAPGGVRGDQPAVEDDGRVGDVPPIGVGLDAAQRQPGAEDRLVDVALQRCDLPPRRFDVAVRDALIAVDLDLDPSSCRPGIRAGKP